MLNSGLTKTQVYYPSATRPRSFSAGCTSTTSVTGRPGSANAVKVIKVNNARFSFPRTKSADEARPSTVRYKTELCRPFQDYGFCRYGDKCQFAHGEDDLKLLPRHPKYKTDLCRTYHTRGFCPYGSRCHFIHNLEEARKNSEDSPPSPTQKALSFSLPISPLLDSGISSPDDNQYYSNGGSGVFDFQSIDSSSASSSSEDSDFIVSCSPETNTTSYFTDSLEIHEKYDTLSVGSSSPMKRVSDLFDPEPPQDLGSMIQGLEIKESCSSPLKGSGRLPVFDTIAGSNETIGNPFLLSSSLF